MPTSYLLAALLGYLCGSIPTAYWLGLAVYRVNIFELGSRNMGATNVHRVLGKVPFAITLALDILKGMVPVLLAPRLVTDPASLMPHCLTAGLAAVAGHTLSFWVKFRGGKGVATGLGVFLALAPKSSILAMGIFLVTLIATGFVSLGSMVAAVALPVMIFAFQEGGPDWHRPLALAAAAIAAFIVFKHRANIRRLLNGEELALGTKPPPTLEEGK
ncbi:MAG: glycerol-3-phosphate 1-O-acyltransferase PlsY [Candidatus Riflebacteria bacterium]|nr:glycerol-3-phosphate 1-O-acyltransferase PlsY [Candidatus Riflebacteria bacterium]